MKEIKISIESIKKMEQTSKEFQNSIYQLAKSISLFAETYEQSKLKYIMDLNIINRLIKP